MAACLVDPMTNPVASSPFGKFRSGYGSTVHQGFDLAPSGKDRKDIKLFSAAKGKIAWAGFRRTLSLLISTKQSSSMA